MNSCLSIDSFNELLQHRFLFKAMYKTSLSEWRKCVEYYHFPATTPFVATFVLLPSTRLDMNPICLFQLRTSSPTPCIQASTTVWICNGASIVASSSPTQIGQHKNSTNVTTWINHYGATAHAYCHAQIAGTSTSYQNMILITLQFAKYCAIDCNTEEFGQNQKNY